MIEEIRTKGKLSPIVVNQQMITVDLLGKKISLGPAKVELKELKIVGNVDQLYDSLVSSSEDNASIELETIEEADLKLDWFQPKPDSKEGKQT